MRQIRTLPIAVAALAAFVAACSTGASPSPTSPAVQASPQATQPVAQATMQLMAAGMFHGVDGTATGEAQLIVAPTGTYEVVFENFEISSLEHTNVVLVSNADVTKSADVDPSKLLDLGPLKSTSGMQDFAIPADMAGSVMQSYHTVVLWDTAMTHAIAAAPLK
jgi:hypothetical protein